MEAFFRGSHTTNFVTCGFNRSYNQAAQVPSSNVTCSSPRSPLMNCRMMLAFVSTTHSSTILPAEFMTAMEMLSLWTSMPIYFGSFIGDAPFGRRWDQHSLTYSRGAPLYCVALSSSWICGILTWREDRFTELGSARAARAPSHSSQQTGFCFPNSLPGH